MRIAVIFILGFLAFASMLPAPFRIMDDRISIVENPIIKSARQIPQIFKEGYFHDQSYYRPLINLSFMAEYHLFGLNSFFYNLDNLILHILNAVLVMLLVLRLTGNSFVAFGTAVLFVVHPIQWEAVCNVPGRAILLSAFFELSSFVLFLEYYLYRRSWALPLVLLTFFLSLLCKESAGMLPLVIAAFLMVDRSRNAPRKIVSLWPLVVAVLAYVSLRKYFGITDLHSSGQPMVVLLGFVTFLRSVITDLRLFLLPIDLHYDRSLPFMMSWHQPQAVVTVLFWLIAVGLVLFNVKKIKPFCLFLMAWFGLELLPVSQLVTSIGVGIGHISTAEHFLYLACIPVFIGMVLFFQWLLDFNARRRWLDPGLLKISAAAFLVFLWLISVEQSIYAANEYAMVNRSLGFEPNNARLQGEMAMLSVFRGDIPDAQKHFELAVKAEPANPKYHIALGTALCQQNHWIEGLEQFVIYDPGKDKELVEREEKMTMMHIEQALAHGQTYDERGWLAIGIYQTEHGRNAQASEAFTKVIQLDPGQPDAWFNLASLQEAMHDFASAKIAYAHVLNLPLASPFQKDFAVKHLALMEKK